MGLRPARQLFVLVACSLVGSFAAAQSIDECGQLTVAGCIIFQADSGVTYELSDAAGYYDTGRVRVQGQLDAAHTPTCAGTTERVAVTAISDCTTEFAACGRLIQADPCILLAADAGYTYVLDQAGGFGVGDRVQVTGTLDLKCSTPCIVRGCITVGVLSACDSPFESCGLLVDRGDCVALAADHGGVYALDTLGGFVAGERVRVSGTVDTNCSTSCEPTDGCLTVAAMEACPLTFVGCGTLMQVNGCIVLSADNGGTCAVANLGDLQVGQRACVSGTLGACACGTRMHIACLVENTIASMPESFDACGTLVTEQGCTLLRSDAGQLYGVENLDSFRAGDRVAVVGLLDRAYSGSCSAADGFIRDNSITDGTATCAPRPTSTCAATSASLLAVLTVALARTRRVRR